MKRGRRLLAGIAALALIAFPMTVAHPSEADRASVPVPTERISPPAGDMQLSRTVIRVLGDGKLIVVTRHYRIRFVATARGYQIEGTLVGVNVDAPPILAALADLERRRPDNGLFPMEVDASGRLLDQQVAQQDAASRRAAATAAGAVLAANSPDPNGPLTDLENVRGLIDTNPNTPWPADLFRAQPGERKLSRDVALRDGQQGRVEVVMRVDALLPCGMPHQTERTVTTRLGSSSRISKEVFTLTQSPG